MQRAQQLLWGLFEKKPTAEELAEKDRKAAQALARLAQIGLFSSAGLSLFITGTSTLTLALAGLGAYTEIIAKKYYEKSDPDKSKYIAANYSKVSIFCNMFHTIIAQPVAASLMKEFNEYRQHR